MKKWLLLLSLFLGTYVSAAPLQERRIEPLALSELADFFKISEDDLIAGSQARWLRKTGQERWEMAELSLEQKQFVLRWAEGQGIFTEWRPAVAVYERALILGATTERMEGRLSHLRKLWEEGVRFQEVVWLTGERPLDPRVDSLAGGCRNESEAAGLIWGEADLPPGMRALPLVFISVPMKQSERGPQRPNTQDTLLAWLDTSPSTGSSLFITDQPFCGYQYAIIRSCLPDSFAFDLAGPGADPSSHPAAAAITLDAIARWVYQDHLNEH